MIMENKTISRQHRAGIERPKWVVRAVGRCPMPYRGKTRHRGRGGVTGSVLGHTVMVTR